MAHSGAALDGLVSSMEGHSWSHIEIVVPMERRSCNSCSIRQPAVWLLSERPRRTSFCQDSTEASVERVT